MPKRKRSSGVTTVLVPDRFFTKGAWVTFGAFTSVLLTLGGFGVKAIQAIDANQATLDKHTELIQKEAEDVRNFKTDFKIKIEDDSKAREQLRSTFLDNATKTAQGIADLNSRAVKTETAYQFLNDQVGQVVQQLKELNATTRNNASVGHR